MNNSQQKRRFYFNFQHLLSSDRQGAILQFTSKSKLISSSLFSIVFDVSGDFISFTGPSPIDFDCTWLKKANNCKQKFRNEFRNFRRSISLTRMYSVLHKCVSVHIYCCTDNFFENFFAFSPISNGNVFIDVTKTNCCAINVQKVAI